MISSWLLHRQNLSIKLNRFGCYRRKSVRKLKWRCLHGLEQNRKRKVKDLLKLPGIKEMQGRKSGLHRKRLRMKNGLLRTRNERKKPKRLDRKNLKRQEKMLLKKQRLSLHWKLNGKQREK